MSRKCQARPLKWQVSVARRRAHGGDGSGRPTRMPRHRRRKRGQLGYHNVGVRPWRPGRIGAGAGGEDGRLQRWVHRGPLLRPAGKRREDLADRDLLLATATTAPGYSSLGDRVGSDRGRIEVLGSGAACDYHELVRAAMRGVDARVGSAPVEARVWMGGAEAPRKLERALCRCAGSRIDSAAGPSLMRVARCWEGEIEEDWRWAGAPCSERRREVATGASRSASCPFWEPEEHQNGNEVYCPTTDTPPSGQLKVFFATKALKLARGKAAAPSSFRACFALHRAARLKRVREQEGWMDRRPRGGRVCCEGLAAV